MNHGKIFCVGLGPGDPDMMSVKADRLLRSARHVAYFRKRGHPGKARQLVNGLLHAEVTEYPMEYPLTTEIPHDDPRYIAQLSSFYQDWQSRLTQLTRSEDVIVLCEGDPFFYGSFMHLYVRLRQAGQVTVEVLRAGSPVVEAEDLLERGEHAVVHERGLERDVAERGHLELAAIRVVAGHDLAANIFRDGS